MKNPMFRPVHKVKQLPTNAAPDTHKKFCDRCFAHNNGCLMTRSKAISKGCAV